MKQTLLPSKEVMRERCSWICTIVTKLLFANKWDNQGFFRQSTVNECAHFRFVQCVVWSWMRLFMITFPIRLIFSMYSETAYSLPIVLRRSFGFRLQWPKQSSGTVSLKIFRFWYGSASASIQFVGRLKMSICLSKMLRWKSLRFAPNGLILFCLEID